MNNQPSATLQQKLHHHLTQIVRERDPYLATGGHFLVREYVRQSLAQWGKVEVHEFDFRGKIHQNLVLNLTGASSTNLPPILIGAHYDAVPGTPGADDNATGIAALLELAAVFAVTPLQFPLRLVAFDLEEYGKLGSQAYAEELKQRGEKLRLMFSLEMLGYCDRTANSQRYPDLIKPFYPDRGDFITLVGNLTATIDLFRLSRIIKKNGTPCQILPDLSSGKLIPITGFSDHASFWEQKYRAIMVTDTAMLRNPHYHQASDTIATLDLEFFSNVCQSLIVALRAIR